MLLKKITSFLFPFYIVLIYYDFGISSLGDVLLFSLTIVNLINHPVRFKFKPLLFLIVFIIFWDLIIIIFGDVTPQFFLNREIIILSRLCCVLILSHSIDFQILQKSIFVIAVIASVGVIYHNILLFFGEQVKMITFIDFEESRHNILNNRPLSIFPEPAAIVSFLIIPLFLTFFLKKIFYSVLISFVVLLTTSSTGLLYLLIFWGIFLFKNRSAKNIKYIFLLLISVILFYSNSTFQKFTEKSIFDITKFYDQDEYDNLRLLSGPALLSYFSYDQLVFGHMDYSVAEFIKGKHNQNLKILLIEDTPFLPSFWLIWVNYGIIGLILYFNVYFHFMRKYSHLKSLCVVLFAGMFVQQIAVSAVYIFYIIFLIAFAKNQKKQIIYG